MAKREQKDCYNIELSEIQRWFQEEVQQANGQYQIYIDSRQKKKSATVASVTKKESALSKLSVL